MKIVTVRVGGPLEGDTCRHCKRKCRPGQVVFDTIMFDAPPNNQHFTVHARCMTKLVEAAPPDADVSSFLATREAIITTGDPYAVAN